MASTKKDPKTAEPMIRFGGQWIPAHDLWSKMETANVVADAIERFNSKFPELANTDTRDVVPLVRQRLKDIDLRMPGKEAKPDLSSVVAELLRTMPPEDVIATLRDKHEVDVDFADLIKLGGAEAYAGALSREADTFKLNQISPEQTAELWNEAARPCPEGGLWTARKVEILLNPKTA